MNEAVVYKHWPPYEAEVQVSSAVSKFAHREAQCGRCGELFVMWCNFTGQFFYRCEHCVGYTVHSTRKDP